MTTEELTADQGEGEAEAIAHGAPDDDGELLGDDPDEDGGFGEDEDAAAVAGRWRRDARDARERAARVEAEAEERKRRIDGEAWSERQRLDAAASEAEEQAAAWQVIADRDAEIASAETVIASLTAGRDALRAEETALTAEADQLGARLGEFGAARAEARQKLAGAPQIADVGESIAAVRDANDTLAAIGEAERPWAARLTAVQARLGEIRGHEEQRDPWGNWRGPAAGLPALEQDLGRLRGRLGVLRRQASGLPPEGEVAQLAIALIAAVPESPEVPPTARVLALPQAVRDVESLAVADPEEYARLRRRYLEPGPPEPGRAPTAREVLGLGPQQQPVPVQLPDGGWTMGFRVAGAPLAGGAVTGGR